MSKLTRSDVPGWMADAANITSVAAGICWNIFLCCLMLGAAMGVIHLGLALYTDRL